ncbi:probable E3 ubiquitin-protein ligase RHG1A [Dioscorea cayenensis subsp. rotundata]|uniref:Probable E3 ubiquitin-protein ligase RHG1A n=1 Tax=Dioscorea cayennensis subsp. rotundata TaxID=55577 RepID=A0AB40B2Q9_DIOCR|nr:probable E3 ubiquitin-protein ligase RHG1A [Dioscorea cayenensis subsp. rotundata]XP_039121379.1 probable E3 ubiquitin-protein ligase RHG1A [Dioscorea cayenensis subsp. rotundata]
MSSSIMSSPTVRQSPFSDDPNWFYTIHSSLGNLDIHHVFTDNTPPPPPLTIDLKFTTYTFSSFTNLAEQPLPLTTETKRFMLDIQDFNQRFSAEQTINSMIRNTSTGATLSIERRRWMVSDISNFMMSFVRDGYNEIFINLDVVELVPDEDLDGILRESFEDAELSACPASHALLESLVTEVFRDDEEAVSCMICLEEFVAGVEVKRLPCSHLFHGGCIDSWFVRKDSCPLCRFTLHEELDS